MTVDRIERALRIVMTEAIILLAVAVATGWLIWQQQNQAGVVRCEVRYEVAYASVQKYRTTLANESADATATLIREVFTPVPGTQAQKDAAIEHDYLQYAAMQQSITDARNSHPVPDPPHC